MTLTQPESLDPPLPADAQPDQWIGGQRDVYAIIGHVAVSPDLLKCPAVTTLAEQRRDGTLGCTDVLVDVDPMCNGLSARQARELAALLQQGADLADRWTGTAGPSTTELLARASSVLRVAHSALRSEATDAVDDDEFGAYSEATSYVQATLDTIQDALEVLR